MDNYLDNGINTSFDSDQPIAAKKQDRLGRSNYADSIASYINNLPVDRGFTIAVMGEWGSGKTSLLNMVAEALDEGENSIPHLALQSLAFWRYAGTTCQIL